MWEKKNPGVKFPGFLEDNQSTVDYALRQAEYPEEFIIVLVKQFYGVATTFEGFKNILALH